jgi:hypothetical protein
LQRLSEDILAAKERKATVAASVSTTAAAAAAVIPRILPARPHPQSPEPLDQSEPSTSSKRREDEDPHEVVIPGIPFVRTPSPLRRAGSEALRLSPETDDPSESSADGFDTMVVKEDEE